MAVDDNLGAVEQDDDGILIVELGGYEGPLDLLLELSRKQKVDIRKISILRLVEQYAEFIEKARLLKINLAADYLVMAAWLALIKSRLLIPKEPPEAVEEDALATGLAFRLQQLNAMRESAKTLTNRRQLGQDFFARGDPEQFAVKKVTSLSANVLDLTQAYLRVRSRDHFNPYQMNRAMVYSVEEALENLQSMLPHQSEWQELVTFLPPGWTEQSHRRRSALASTFAASLELAKQGQLKLRQSNSFSTMQLRGTSQENRELS